MTLTWVVAVLAAMHLADLLDYPANVAVGLWNLLRATAGQYRPNGDGYVHSWFYALDCLGNALAGGDPWETISSRSGKARANGRVWACVLCRLLAWITRKDHCGESILPNQGSRAIDADGE